jgi:hypothetical protein
MGALEAHLQRQSEHSRDFFWHRIRWRAVEEQLAGPSFTLTDVGAGIGLVGDYLARDYPGAVYRFVEPLDSLEQDLRARFGPEASANGVSSYSDSRYVTLLDVLEHIEDDRAFLQDLTAKMARGATLIMTVPALDRLWSQWDVSLGHYRRYDKGMLRSLVAEVPLRAREISYLFPEMLPPALIRARKRLNGTGAKADDRAEFPDLPRRVNELLYRIGTTSLRFRRAWPAGTSLLLVADRV